MLASSPEGSMPATGRGNRRTRGEGILLCPFLCPSRFRMALFLAFLFPSAATPGGRRRGQGIDVVADFGAYRTKHVMRSLFRHLKRINLLEATSCDPVVVVHCGVTDTGS